MIFSHADYTKNTTVLMLLHVTLSLGKDYKLSLWSAFFCADQNEMTSCNIHKPGSQAQTTLESARPVYKN